MATPPSLTLLTIARAVDEYMDAVRAEVARGVLADTTATTYARDLADFAMLAGPDVVLDTITGPQIDDLLLAYQRTPDARYRDPGAKSSDPRGQGRSVRTTNRFRQSVARFTARAALMGWVQADPMIWASRPARIRTPLRIERTALPAEAAAALVATTHEAPSTPTGRAPRTDQALASRDRLILLLLTVLGPRVSEVSAANLDDFSRDSGGARWRITGKGGKTRHVPVSKAVWEALVDYRDGLRPRLAEGTTSSDDERALLLSWRGRRVDAQTIRQVTSRAMARVDPALRRGVTPHALRHTTATILVAEGWDVKVVADLLGHESIATTGIYLDHSYGHLAAAVESNPLNAAARAAGSGDTQP